jgi:hypothetical protein
MKDVPILNCGELFVVSIGASEILLRNQIDPCLFISLRILPPKHSQATNPLSLPPATFLIDSGATHDFIGETYTKSSGLLDYARPSKRTISGFEGSSSHSSFDIHLTHDTNPSPSPFIITQLKDSYNGILGMPCIRKHGHLIDWTNWKFRTTHQDYEALSLPKKPSPIGVDPVRQARKFDEGVCVFETLTPLQCESNKAPLPNFPLEAAGNPLSFIGNRTHPITKTGHWIRRTGPLQLRQQFCHFQKRPHCLVWSP